MKITLRLIGLVGVVLFGAAFTFTYSVPGGVEDAAKEFIKQRIEDETRQKIDSLTHSAQDTKLAALAGKLLQRQESQIAVLKAGLHDKVHEKAAAVIAEMRDLSCECRRKYAQFIKEGMESEVSLLQAADEKIVDFMKSKYMEVATKLTQDLRIFTGSNLAVFAMLLLVSFLKPQAVRHLFLPAVLLVGSTAICSYFYLFRQNWFFTIIYNDYVGFGYLGYVGAVFALFCDIVFNRARVTTWIINALLNTLGAAASLVPC